MSKRIKWIAPPNLAVIDRAIELTDAANQRFSGSAAKYTCHALSMAVMEVEFNKPGIAPQYWSATEDQLNRIYLYRRQYSRCLGTPYWWSSGALHRDSRISALNKFRQACIDAAKEKT